jgi:hypothetical protein
VLIDPAAPPRPHRRVRRRLAMGAGLAAVVIGSFLPWLHSGRATRNSYATDGAVRRLLDVSGPVDAALRAWPFVSLLCAVAAALLLLGRTGLGAALALVAAVAAGGVAAWALASGGRGIVRPAVLGPAVTVAGAIITVFGVLACAPAFDRRTGRGFR